MDQHSPLPFIDGTSEGVVRVNGSDDVYVSAATFGRILSGVITQHALKHMADGSFFTEEFEMSPCGIQMATMLQVVNALDDMRKNVDEVESLHEAFAMPDATDPLS